MIAREKGYQDQNFHGKKQSLLSLRKRPFPDYYLIVIFFSNQINIRRRLHSVSENRPLSSKTDHFLHHTKHELSASSALFANHRHRGVKNRDKMPLKKTAQMSISERAIKSLKQHPTRMGLIQPSNLLLNRFVISGT